MDIVIFITLLVISYKASGSIRKNSEILKELDQSNILSILVFIYPVGPLLLFTGSFIPVMVLYPLVAACFVPQLVIARKQINALSCTGTDRADEAKEALSFASLGAMIGLIYLSAGMVMTLAAHSVASGYY